MTQKQSVNESGWHHVDVIARLLNLTARRVQQLAKEGHIPQGRRGHYDLVPSVQGYCRYMQNLVAGQGDNAFQTARAAVARERAEALARENAIARGELIPRGEVVRGLQQALVYVRSKMLSIPTKAAAPVVLLETPAEVKDHLTTLVHDALDELSRTRFVGTGTEKKPPPKKTRRKPKKATK